MSDRRAPHEPPAPSGGEQLALVRATHASKAPRARRSTPKPPAAPAPTRPVARVAVDVPLPHLDRPFEYLVPEGLHESAQPGVRVRVRFSGQLVDGFLLDRVDTAEHTGRLAPLARVVSPEPVLHPHVLALARAVADRYAGTLADVLRLAIPPRHAAVEGEPPPATDVAPRPPPSPPEPASWARYVGGAAFLRRLAAGESPRAVWTALPGGGWPGEPTPPGGWPTPPGGWPGEPVAPGGWPALPGGGWPGEFALAVRATLASGRGAVAVVPDSRDLSRLLAALRAELGAATDSLVVALAADLGPAERYRRWLAASRGSARVVVGTRAAAFAPVTDLGLVAVWDDGDDLHAEPRAPYPHVREVLALRAQLSGAGALIGGHARTAEGQRLLATGWASPLEASRAVVRTAAPRVRTVGEDAELARDPAARAARLPSLAWQVAHEALTRGPVLVQVPRRGYVPALACQGCRAPARCRHCGGALRLAGVGQAPSCRLCGRSDPGWSCPGCGGRQVRARVTGDRRTAEELGRAFPSVPVRASGGGTVLESVPGEPALVVATPGAEPVAEGGYAAALLLDGWALLDRPELRSSEEALRRWANAAALVRPGGRGGTVVVLADPGLPAVQALVRWDPGWFAERELAERRELRFPPAARLAEVVAPAGAAGQFLEAAGLPASADVLGPLPVPAVPGGGEGATGERERVVVRVPLADGQALAAGLKAAQAGRSLRKLPGNARVVIDPIVIA